MGVEAPIAAAGYVRNSSLAVFQRRLLSPAYMGPGKWVIFDARTRRSHLAVRHEQDLETKAIPRVLRYLLHSPAGGSDVTVSQVTQLAAAGLLVPPEDNSPDAPNFITLFQQSVFDYPFVDYASPAAFEFDAALMAEYASVSPMPSPWTERPGQTVELPHVTWEDLPTRPRSSSFGIKELAAVLRFAFGAIGTFDTPGGERVRKANPSGGAKHPTEGWLELSGTWQGIASGCYVYDAQHHRLVGMPGLSGQPGDAPFTLSVRSRVERAMWRYRDSRSTRAVLLDAGHVVENILMLLELFGVSASLRPAFPGTTGDASRLREPEVARIELDQVRVDVSTMDQQEPAAPAGSAEATVGEPLITNPLAYFTFGDQRFQAHSLFPELTTRDLDEIDFAILTHCIPSHRGTPSRPRDRRTRLTDVLEAIPDADETRLAALAADGLLLAANRATPLYREVRRWAESGWYLPLLAWQEATVSGGAAVVIGNPCNRAGLNGIADVSVGLRNRVTTRSFRREPVAVDLLVELVRTAYRAADGETVGCYVAPLTVAGVENGVLHRWDAASDRLDEVGRSVSADDIVKITIGQGWVGGCAAMIWLVAHVDLARPGRYFAPHLLLGRMAQRVCVHATIDGLGVFQTPATRDGLLCATLGLPPSPALTTYSLAVGWPSRKTASSKEHRGSTR